MSEHHLHDEHGTLRVALQQRGDALRVTVDDTPCPVARVARGPRSTHAGATTETLAFDLGDLPVRALVTRTADAVTVVIDGQLHRFATGDAAGTTTGHRIGSGTVIAPMPGKIIAVLVTVGETVDVGQGLVVLEAMKMESTLAAEIAGTVMQVNAIGGDLVEGGVVLVEIAAA